MESAQYHKAIGTGNSANNFNVTGLTCYLIHFRKDVESRSVVVEKINSRIRQVELVIYLIIKNNTKSNI